MSQLEREDGSTRGVATGAVIGLTYGNLKR